MTRAGATSSAARPDRRARSMATGFTMKKNTAAAIATNCIAAVMNAVVDALWRTHRTHHIDLPATATRRWAALEEGRRLHPL